MLLASSSTESLLIRPERIDHRSLTGLLGVVLIEPLCHTILFPYIIYLIQDFHIAKTHAEEGMYAGLLVASFSLAQFLTSIWWGYLSDRLLSKRAVLIIGLVGTMFMLVAFGLCRDFWSAMIVRLIAGGLNGNMAVSKAVLSEVRVCFNSLC
jgi:MFS family permease